MKILKKYGLTEKELERILVQRKKPKIRKLDRLYKDHTEVKIAIVSDTHLGSKYEALQALHNFYEFAAHENCKCVLHAGDLIDGAKIYRGQEYEVHTHGVDAQVDYVRRNYPRNLPTYFLTGNHDYAWVKLAGVDIGTMVADDDLRYLGALQADIEIAGIKFRLFHGEGGSSYALSYKAQKIAEQIPSAEKPNVLLCGHWHVSHYFFYRNMHIINCGAFQRQTPYLMRKGINPTIGGWVVTLRHQEGRNIGIDLSFILFP
jgi:predicted phosphodiesterase